VTSRSDVAAAKALVLFSALACLVGLISGYRWSQQTYPMGQAMTAQLALFDRLAEPVRGRQAIGLFFDPPRPGGPYTEYFLAQYALAPIRIREGGRHALHLGVFNSQAERDDFIGSGQLRFVKGVSSRIALFETIEDGKP
jgi:hypothetical protein